MNFHELFEVVGLGRWNIQLDFEVDLVQVHCMSRRLKFSHTANECAMFVCTELTTDRLID